LEGQIMDTGLTGSGLTREWLEVELEKLGAALENVYIGQVDSYGQLTVDLYDDQITIPTPQEKPLLLSALKKCQADLEKFGLATENKEAKQMYTRQAKKLEELINKAEYLLIK